MSKQNNQLSWWEPSSRRVSEISRELTDIYSLPALVRIAIAVACISVIAAFLLKRYLPELEFDWVKATLKAFGIGCLMIAASSLLAFLPRQIRVTEKGIFITQGQSTSLIRYSNIAMTTLHMTLRTLHVRLRDRDKTHIIHVNNKINLSDLVVAIEAGWKRTVMIGDI